MSWVSPHASSSWRNSWKQWPRRHGCVEQCPVCPWGAAAAGHSSDSAPPTPKTSPLKHDKYAREFMYTCCLCIKRQNIQNNTKHKFSWKIKSTNKGEHSKDNTQTHLSRLQLLSSGIRVNATYTNSTKGTSSNSSKYKVHKLHQRYMWGLWTL